MNHFSQARKHFKPQIAKVLTSLMTVSLQKGSVSSKDKSVQEAFPITSKLCSLVFEKDGDSLAARPLKVGVVFSGGQAPGGHNVICGLFDALKEIHKDAELFGFLGGPSGIVDNKYKALDSTLLFDYRNQGGFDLIGSGRTKIETKEQMEAALKTVKGLQLDGLVIIGGDDSNTNAALLAEFFLTKDCTTSIIGIPKTIDGDLKAGPIEISFGFDTATKVYSQIIGNIARDCISAKKYYHFIKVMGRSASHIALECALKTQPNLTLISEEVQAKKMKLTDLVRMICNLIEERAKINKNYGVILIPEGLIEFIPEIKLLIQEINDLLSKNRAHTTESIKTHLSPESLACYNYLPLSIKEQLILDRDPHGNVQVSLIETEKLFIEMVKNELSERKKQDSYKGKFSALHHFLGYEGRAAYPSHFDCNYCYNLGRAASLLILSKATGYILGISDLHKPVAEWRVHGVALAELIHMERRHGSLKPVIQKALVNLQGKPFLYFEKHRSSWEIEDSYTYPGPIQYWGDSTLTDDISLTLGLEKS